MPHKTRFHELAHVLLGHTSEGVQADSEITPRNQRECEAESVALLCCAALDLPGVAECRGYVQHWWGQGNPIPERSAQRILKTADQILKAGTSAVEEVELRRVQAYAKTTFRVLLIVGGMGFLAVAPYFSRNAWVFASIGGAAESSPFLVETLHGS